VADSSKGISQEAGGDVKRPEDGPLSESPESSSTGSSGTGPPGAVPKTTRRGFLKGTGSAVAASAGLSAPTSAKAAPVPPLKLEGADATTTICPFCGVGCGQIVYTKTEKGQKKIIHTEGDSDHPISEGTLCSKGASISQLTKNDRRLKHVMYRAPGASEFVQKDWDWALKEIAKRVKKTRDESFELESGGRTVNRTEAIACLGGAALDNEEAYLLVKAMRSFGLTYIEHQARI
jgi:formate dehydrogenase major subunit